MPPLWVRTLAFKPPIATIGRNAVHEIDNPNDVRVCMFRLAKKRDSDVFSYVNSVIEKQQLNLTLVLSMTVVHRALRGLYDVVSIMCTKDLLQALEPLLAERELVENIYVIKSEHFKQIVGIEANNTQQCAALVNLTPVDQIFGVDSVIARIPKISTTPYIWEATKTWGTPHRHSLKEPYLVLDDVRSADNIGVILRTAFSLGIRSIIMSRVTYKSVGCRTARTSMGGIFMLDLYVSQNMVTTLQELSNGGIMTLCASPQGTEVIGPISHDMWALVMGNEELGSSEEVLSACSKRVCIPQAGGDSLSVSVAAGICLFAIRQNTMVLDHSFRSDC